MNRQPQSSEYPPYYAHYISLVKEDNILRVLKNQVIDIQALISGIPEDKENYAYAEGKWTIKEVLGHVIDTERIFGYRAMRMARKDKTMLPGFDENTFVENAQFNKRTLYDLAHEFAIVRESHLASFKHFDEIALNQIGNANGKEVSVRAILYMIAGHAAHHMDVIKTRYLID
ncbi:MAG: DinB family protein [Bacteroidetes bacterium]|nr:DinB family protein [Bacteroidota bacterium]